jgi:hypothetical protein
VAARHLVAQEPRARQYRRYGGTGRRSSRSTPVALPSLRADLRRPGDRPTPAARWTGDGLFAGCNAQVRVTFDRILAVLQALGPVEVLPEITRIALHVQMSFAALTPRRHWLDGQVVCTFGGAQRAGASRAAAGAWPGPRRPSGPELDLRLVGRPPRSSSWRSFHLRPTPEGPAAPSLRAHERPSRGLPPTSPRRLAVNVATRADGAKVAPGRCRHSSPSGSAGSGAWAVSAWPHVSRMRFR